MTVVDDFPVRKTDNTVGVLICKLRIMRYHNHKLILRNLLDKIHNLNTGCAVKRAGRLVAEQDLRIIRQCAGDGHALHLPAGELVRLFVKMLLQPHLLQRLERLSVLFLARYPGESHAELHVCDNAQMSDQIIALKHKADRIVPVRIPVTVPEIPGALSLDPEISGIILIQPADNVKAGCFSRTARSQNGNEFPFPECHADAVQRFCFNIPHMVGFPNIL